MHIGPIHIKNGGVHLDPLGILTKNYKTTEDDPAYKEAAVQAIEQGLVMNPDPQADDSAPIEIDLDQILDDINKHPVAAASAGAMGLLIMLYIREPEKYGPVLQSIISAVPDTIKGIGEVIPG